MLLEACVSSVSEAQAACLAGAQRLELCSALELGGLTPSVGLTEAVLSHVSIPVVVMLRPRCGGFNYDGGEINTMQRDAQRLLQAGAAGVVFGFLERGGHLNAAAVADFVALAGTAQTVFHRAFDFIPEPLSALEQLITLGVRRILTSGGANTAIEGASLISQLVHQSAGRIEILPGGGIRAHNIHQLAELTGCTDFHIGASRVITDGSIDHHPALNLNDARCWEGHRFRQLEAEVLRAAVTPHPS